MSYFIYILLCKDGSFYTGSTNDVEKRLKAHFAGAGARYTKSHKPVKLIYSEEFPTKKEAMQREYQIKSWSKDKKKDLVENFGNKQNSSDKQGRD
jgi:putative endonuclease